MNQQRVEQAMVKALQLAGEWLADACRAMVGIQTGMDGPGSPEGTPPFRRTGRGQASIGVENTATGCRVGVTAMEGIPGSVPGQNYMAGWDVGMKGQQRPWLMVWRDRYSLELNLLIKRFFEIQMRQMT